MSFLANIEGDTWQEKLQFSIEIIGVTTKREKSGLAISSRNKLLLPEDLEKAAIIYKTLKLKFRGNLSNYPACMDISPDFVSKMF